MAFFSTVTGKIDAQYDRDAILVKSDRDLADMCNIDAFTASGPGGQHRNRNYTAIRVTLKIAPELVCSDTVSRSQKQNLEAALQKMRIKIACSWRKKAPELSDYQHLNEKNQLFALELAKLLDMVCACNFDHKSAAVRLGISNTMLLKELSRLPEVWQHFRSCRAELGLSELKLPGR